MPAGTDDHTESDPEDIGDQESFVEEAEGLISEIQHSEKTQSPIHKPAKRARKVGPGPYGKPHSIEEPDSVDSEDEFDVSKFLDDNFWQPCIKAKREIKVLKKQLRKRERVLAKHLTLID